MSDLSKIENDAYIYDEPMMDHNSQSDGLGTMVSGVLKRWYIILLIFIMGSAIGVPVAYFKIKPSYTVVGQIHVKPILQNIITGESERGQISNYDVFMNTQASMMQQNLILQNVGNQLIESKLEMFSHGEDPVTKLRRLFEKGAIVISPKRKTELIQISMKGEKAAEAKIVVGAFLDAYMEYYEQEQERGGGARLAKLVARRSELINKISITQGQISLMGEEYGTTELSAQQEITNNMIMKLKEQLTDLEIRKMDLEIRKKILVETKGIIVPKEQSLPQVQMEVVNADPRVLKLIDSISIVERVLIGMKETMAESNYELIIKNKELVYLQEQLESRRVEVKAEYLASLSGQSSDEKDVTLNAIELELTGVNAYIKKYQTMLTEKEVTRIVVGKDQLGINDLSAELVVQQELLAQLIRRIQDVELENKQPARVKSVGEASELASEDKRKKLIPGIIVGSLVAGLALAFLLFKLDGRVASTADIVRCSKVPLIGTTVGLSYLNKNEMAFQITEDYQNIRANIQMNSALDGVPKILGITSPGIGEGKTTMAINLAISMAKSGSRVLLIDGDFRKPDIVHILGLDMNKLGLQDVLSSKASIEECVSTVNKISLDVLSPVGTDIALTYELLVHPNASQVIKDISKKYDQIIIDTAPILAAQDSLLWGRLTDGVIMTCFSGQTNSNSFEEAYQRLVGVGIRVLGTVLNNVKVNDAYYAYGYGYGYGNSKKQTGKRNSPRPLLINQLDNSNTI